MQHNIIATIVALVIVALFVRAQAQDRALAQYSTCVNANIAHDHFRGTLEEAWAYYQHDCQ